MTLKADQFSAGALELLSKELLSKSENARFVQIRMYGETRPVPKADHESYEHWRRFYDQMNAESMPFAEVTAIGQGAVLRFRGTNRSIERIVLRDRDPLSISIEGAPLEILEISVVEAPGRKGPNKEQAAIFLKTPAVLTSDVGERVLRKLRQLIPIPIVGVSLRHDEWFITSPGFPIVYPFSEASVPPSAEKYRESVTLHCGFYGERVRCVGAKAQ
jgi:hypothetical protein